MKRSILWGMAGLTLAIGCGDSGGAGGGGSGTVAVATSTSTKASVTVTSGNGQPNAAGAACEADGDCGGGLVCLKSSENLAIFGDSGPGNGYCSALCTTDTDCPGGLCIGTGADKRCVETCVLGEPVMEFLDDPLDENKCHGREDVRCATVGADDICVPTCRSDLDCGSRKCDPRSAFCVDTPHTGDPNGTACDQMNDMCEGICVNFTDGATMCSNQCSLGGPDLDLECGGLTKGLCVFRPAGHEVGDGAFCTQGCSKHDDCQNPTFWCVSIGGITGSAVPNGFCFGTDDCPQGQVDCTGTDVCTPTQYGPKCLDATFPLDGSTTSSTTSSSSASTSTSSASSTASSSSTGP